MQVFNVYSYVGFEHCHVELEDFNVYEGSDCDGCNRKLKYVVKGNDIYDSSGIIKIARMEGDYIFKGDGEKKNNCYYERARNAIYCISGEKRKIIYRLECYDHKVVIRKLGNDLFDYTLDVERDSAEANNLYNNKENIHTTEE